MHNDTGNEMAETLTGGKRVIYPPNYHNRINSSSAVVSVLLADDEEVEWHWYHSQAGSMITGYTIKKRIDITA